MSTKEEWINRKVSYNLKTHVRSYKAALYGFVIAVKYELNFIIELGIAFAAVVLGLFFGISKIEWILVIFLIGITLSAELMNTSIEALVELKRFSPIVKKVKDLAAAAVLIVAVMDVVIGLLIFIPYTLDYFK